MQTACLLSVFVLCLIAPRIAGAADPAEEAFDRGLALMKEGRFDEGCPAIAESQRLDPRPGTLFTLSECEARRGRIATAVAHYKEFVALVDALPKDKRERQKKRAEVAQA